MLICVLTNRITSATILTGNPVYVIFMFILIGEVGENQKLTVPAMIQTIPVFIKYG